MEVTMRASDSGVSGPTQMTLGLVMHRVATTDEQSSLCCPDCGRPFNLHQPDADQPTQLLGTCAACSKWFLLLEIAANGGEIILFEMPSVGVLLEAITRREGARQIV
jgi:hypothetical protein